MVLSTKQCIRKQVYFFLIAVIVAGYSSAADLNIAQNPLFLAGSTTANVMLVLDDSGSMIEESTLHNEWDDCSYWNIADVVIVGQDDLSSGSTGSDNVCLYTKPNYGGTQTCYSQHSDDPATPVMSARMRPGFGLRLWNPNSGIDNPTFLDISKNETSIISFMHDANSFDIMLTNETTLVDAMNPECGSYTNSGFRLTGRNETSLDLILDRSYFDRRVLSADFDASYYNPKVNYSPWSGLEPAEFNNAKANPVDGKAGFLQSVDLTDRFYIVYNKGKAGFTGDRPLRYNQLNYDLGGNDKVDSWDDHTIYQMKLNEIKSWEITYESINGPLGLELVERVTPLSDITDPVESDEIKQNFANWYQYHRSRMFSVISATTKLIAEFPGIRFALDYINSDVIDIDFPVTEFGNATHNQSIIDTLIDNSDDIDGATYLPPVLIRAGQSYQRAGSDAPIISECQASYTMILTDGEWNGFPSAVVSDLDGDGRAGWLSDIAFWYYDNDLRSDLEDKVPTTGPYNSNPKQHMKVIGLAFSAVGELVSGDDGWPDPPLSSFDDWGHNKFDDLWHASFNSEGFYHSATDYPQLYKEVKQIFQNIMNTSGSVAKLTEGSASQQIDQRIFQVIFNSTDWSGDIISRLIDDSGQVGMDDWSAKSRLAALGVDGSGSRVIITRKNTGGGVTVGSPFTNTAGNTELYNALQPSDQVPVNLDTSTALSDVYRHEVLDYIRGKQTYEGTPGFRVRSSKLGDIVNSSAVFVGAPSSPYPDDIATGSLYSNFAALHDSRTPMIYAGANDGMLHGFDTINGDEKLGYVPRALFPYLHGLVRPDYSHRFYVDGTPNVVDAYFYTLGSKTSGQWKTVLVGGLGAGGKAIYALDVTDPDQFTEANADDIALWEITGGDVDFEDLGFTFGKPLITKLVNDEWVAIFGNGYNSTEGNANASGEAVLYIVDIRDGSLIKKISTKSGSTTSQNGLSSIAAVDIDSDFVTDYVYAGDLNGDLWKFDLTASSEANWEVALGTSSDPQPLFSAGTDKPITAAPVVSNHPQTGYLIYFGTGRYFAVEDNDTSSQPDQSFYAIWDQYINSGGVSSPLTDSVLLEQEIEKEFSVMLGGTETVLRHTSNKPIDWSIHKGWKMDLIVQGSGDNHGERAVGQAQLRNGNVIFATQTPGECGSFGNSRFMEVDAISGARLDSHVFDVNNDGKFDANDYTYSTMLPTLNPADPNYPTDGIVASGILSEGIVPQPTIIPCRSGECKLMSGPGGVINSVYERSGHHNVGRQSWRQILLEE